MKQASKISAIKNALLSSAIALNGNIVSDPSMAYGHITSFQKHNIIDQGIPYQAFDVILRNTAFSEKHWAELLHIDKRTLERHKSGNKTFKPLYSDRIIEIVDVILLGLDVFDTEEQFYLWLYTNTYSLGNREPFDLLQTSYGKEMVLDELYRIEHGIFA